MKTEARDQPPADDEEKLVESFVELGLFLMNGRKGPLPDGLVELFGLVISLNRRVERLETSRLKWAGYWDDKKSYRPNEVVTYGGSAWICTQNTSEKPSTHSAAWELMVKSGRDGRPR